ncbi:MAG: hypothetical protein ACKVOU_00220 [Cytophagales bacterium]
MLKKIVTFSLLIATIVLANAQERSKGKDIISNGFYFNVGLSFPSQRFDIESEVTSTTEVGSASFVATTPVKLKFAPNYGVMPNVEIGNQWYFWKEGKMGIGLRASWFQIGIASFALKSIDVSTAFGNSTASTDFSGSLIDLRFVKLAPQFTYAISDEMALDFSFEVAPTVIIVGGTRSGNNVEDDIYANVNAGLVFAPGIKFRYKVFAAGFDFGFASINNAGGFTTFETNTKSVVVFSGSVPTTVPRIYLGFKF